MHVTSLFGDREKKSAPDQIAARARAVVDRALTRIGGQVPTGPVWHSVAMQIRCREQAEFLELLEAITLDCAQRNVAVMGVRCA